MIFKQHFKKISDEFTTQTKQWFLRIKLTYKVITIYKRGTQQTITERNYLEILNITFKYSIYLPILKSKTK